ncbi:hypothetical protein EUX98_g6108 [Antrodiella citrinella]|uniref:Uncharacterized protein n=1 Tax=Antrodiella citrinella TaxID=2447956 RepID=A0A4S4MQ48_9APHY|nr:hypothetical protein EUX98_g6108 [Antrodiella citrinella]
MYARNVLAALFFAMVAAPSALAAPQESSELYAREYDAPSSVFARSYDDFLEARTIDAINNVLKRQEYEELFAREFSSQLEARGSKDKGDASSISPSTLIPVVASIGAIAGAILF